MMQICIYCGSNAGSNPVFRDASIAMTAELASRGLGIVYGGGSHGLMGDVARVALEAHVPLTGIVPARFKSDRTIAPEGASYHFVETMQERKDLMRSLADGFVAYPGGIGTLDEAAETLMLRSLGFHTKPLAFLNVAGFFDPLIDFLSRMTDTGFMKPSLMASIIVCADHSTLADRLLEAMAENSATPD